MTWAFGKAILLGEHAVVYGHPALAGAIDMRVEADFVAAPDGGPLRLHVPDWQLDVTRDQDHPVAAALRALLEAVCPARQLAGIIEVRTGLPAAAGLGSSAALSVALTRLLAQATGDGATPAVAEVERMADCAERCFHDNPSGVDVALAARGGVGVFVRGQGLSVIEAPPLTLAVGLSGQTRRTAELVARVARRLDERPASTRELLDRLGRAARDGRQALERGATEELGRLMSEAHRTLAALSLSTDVLDALVAEAQGAGALGAKLTGAGGGGAVIAAARDREHADAIVAAWRARGLAGFATCLGVRA